MTMTETSPRRRQRGGVRHRNSALRRRALREATEERRGETCKHYNTTSGIRGDSPPAPSCDKWSRRYSNGGYETPPRGTSSNTWTPGHTWDSDIRGGSGRSSGSAGLGSSPGCSRGEDSDAAGAPPSPPPLEGGWGSSGDEPPELLFDRASLSQMSSEERDFGEASMAPWMEDPASEATRDGTTSTYTSCGGKEELMSRIARLVAEEEKARACLEWRVLPVKHSALTLAAEAGLGSTDALHTALPTKRWNNDACRLALCVAITRGDPRTAEAILSTTDFLGMQRAECEIVQDKPTTDSLLFGFLVPDAVRELNLTPQEPPTGISMTGLALWSMLRSMEDTGATQEHERRAEVFKVLMGVPHVAFTDHDAMLVGRCVAHRNFRACGAVRATVGWWEGQLPHLRRTSAHYPSAVRIAKAGNLPKTLPPPRVWEADKHMQYPPWFRRHARVLGRVLGGEVTEWVLPWFDSQKPVKDLDPAFPRFRCIVDSVSGGVGGVRVLDASPCTMASFARVSVTGKAPHAGQRCAAVSAGRASISSGIITGVDLTGSAPLLMWRPHGASASEPLGHSTDPDLRLNPMAGGSGEPGAHGSWLCGMCLVLSPLSLQRCRRCGNTLQSVMALEAQRRRQAHPQNPPLPRRQPPPPQHQAPPLTNTNTQGGGAPVIIRVVRHNHQRPTPAALPPPPTPPLGGVGMLGRSIQLLNLSACPPRAEVFNASEHATAEFGYRSGDLLRLSNGRRGVVGGVGADGALYWLEEGGGGGARVLALNPMGLVRLGPQLLGHNSLPC
eukprot:Hpha_TRINITY_DN16647_c1_g4::TRINITY_DN16647_c1_g4_i1::g.181399::m.181399